MAFVALYDACVLYSAPLRDLLVRLGNTGIVRARWSEPILDECFRSILKNRPDLKPEALRRTRELMSQAVPDCLVTGFDALMESLVLPDPDDRHVLAAAIRAGAQVIVTFNLDDFPEAQLAQYDVEAKHPDEFVLDAIDLARGLVTTVVSEQAAALRAPPRTVGELLDTLRDQGLVRSAAKLAEVFDAADLEAPAGRGNRRRFTAVLAKVPDAESADNDRVPARRRRAKRRVR